MILGPKNSEEEASQYGFQKFGGEFDVHELPTRDKTRATSMIKAKIFDQSSDLEKALQKARHQVPGEKPTYEGD